MDGWCMGHVTPTLDDHVVVNVITAIITAYMMKWQKVLTRSAHVLVLPVCVCKCNNDVRLNVLRGLLGRAV